MEVFDTGANTMLLPGEDIIKKKECEMQKEVKQKLYTFLRSTYSS